MTPARIASCENCGLHGPCTCKYERHVDETDIWYAHLFCDGKCCAEWLRARNHLPNPGIVTSRGRET